MSDTASSIPDWGTGSGVLISRVMDVRIMGLVRRALVDDVAERSAAIASLVCLLKVMIEMMVCMDMEEVLLNMEAGGFALMMRVLIIGSVYWRE
jgi:hypothetical protein